MVVDLAKRVWDHSWRLDPIVRSVLDTDFYKLLMLQMIWGLHRSTPVAFRLINRTRKIRIADQIDEAELRDQLDHVRTLSLSKKELIWLAGNSFYGRRQIFQPEFLQWLAGLRLPEYELRAEDGQYVLEFRGGWAETTLWEIPALTIISELRSRAVLKHMGRFALDVLYARAKAKLWGKLLRLRALDDLALSDFGTRRRHSFLWQSWCVQALKEGLGDAFIGTSNVLLAMENDLEAIGTNAHELPMVYAALAPDDAALAQAPYQVLEDWSRWYGGNLLVVLPDTFGTAAFLRQAPDWVSDWTGFRPDSAPPLEAGEQILAWWGARRQDPRQKLLIFSDAMDVDSIETVHRRFHDRVRLSFGWGTNLTNDFRGCATDGALDPISLVCKVVEAGGRPTVKLSDNLEKTMGDAGEVERYLRVFGSAGRQRQTVLV